MSKFLFVTTYDLRRNTSGNIRTVALMQALHSAGHVVHCIFVPSAHESDVLLYNALTSLDKVILYPSGNLCCNPKTTSGSYAKGRVSLKNRILLWCKLEYNRFATYDIFETAIRNLTKEKLSQLDDSYDYVVSSSDPKSAHKFARKIMELKHYTAKWILYWGDPMSGDVSASKLFPKLINREERKLIAQGDKSIYTNPCASAYMKHRYHESAERIDWIPTSDISKDGLLQSKNQSSNIVGYFGDYRVAYRNILPFYQACVENGIETYIAGSGEVDLKTTDTVKIVGRVPRAEVNQMEEACGILIVIENFTKDGNCIQVPGKLYHYGLTNKHILVVTESKNIAKEYEGYNRFHFVPNDKDQIAATIKKIQTGTTDGISSKPLEAFMPEMIVKQFVDKIEK